MIEYKNLEVWKKSIQLVKETYMLIAKLPDVERYALADQIRRAVISIPANIAEGNGRGSDKENIKFLGYSKGSLFELETELIICIELGYFTKEQTEKIFILLGDISRMLNGFIKKIKQDVQ